VPPQKFREKKSLLAKMFRVSENECGDGG